MSIEYEDVIRNLHQVEVANTDRALQNVFFDSIDELVPVENHKIFYPQGIFTEEGLGSFYFFSHSKITRVSFSTTIDIQEWSYGQISSYKFSLLNRTDYRLEINFKNDESLMFANENDTNIHRQETFKRKIKDIYKLLSEQ